MKRHMLPLALAASLLASSALAGERGYFGLSTSIEAEGFFLNPTLRAVKIAKITPASPAAKAGLQVGDQIIELEGRLVAGSKARELQDLLEKEVGQSLNLKIRRANGDTLPLTLVAAPKVKS